MKIGFIVLAVIFLSSTHLVAMAQSEQSAHADGKHQEIDSSSILYAFRKGQFHGHFRYFLMATDNASGLDDYYAHALGGGIKYETAPYKGFQLGVGGFFIYNVGSSKLAEPDAKTGAQNRYELGLFDLTRPENKNDIDRLEELYLKYNFSHSHIKIGKQLPDMPFINKQDGRMRPTEIDGVMAGIGEIKNTIITAGWIWKISPRSTVEWYSIGESIGVYPQGVAPDGKPSDYRDQLESKGIAILAVERKLGEKINIQLWNQYVENIFNTTMLQAEWKGRLADQLTLKTGVQLTRQDALKDGGNEDPDKTYFQKGSKSLAYSVMGELKHKKWDASLNYTRITKDGRYLMPREWGKDAFYTFLPRERNEGAGDLDAILLKLGYNIPKANLRTTLGYGHYYLPDVKDVALNKYGIPSYSQLNAGLRYDFQKTLQGLDLQLLYVYKGRLGAYYDNEKYLINKVNMSNFNLILNYNF